ncbi:diguanylate cyclase [Actinoplanes sp. NPDC051859]|uniref:diguanylate cyclase n=1 Tax=Actinoplanes sp. NPDC051859 TaxID=3363909 RepID=UPI0037A63C7D
MSNVPLVADCPTEAAALEASILALESSSPVLVDRLEESVCAAAELRAAELQRVDLQMRARLLRADALARSGDTAESARIANEVHPWAVEQDDDHILSRSHRQQSVFFRAIGDLGDALTHALQSVARTSTDGPPGLRTKHLMTLAICLAETGSGDDALRRFGEALAIAAEADDGELMLHVLNNMAYCRYSLGHAGEAEELVRRMYAVADRHALPLTAQARDTVARVEMLAGRLAEAERTLGPVLDGSAAESLTDGDALATCLLTAAEAQRRQGAFDRARTTLETARTLCADRQLSSWLVQVRKELARLHADTGDFRAAYEEFVAFHEGSEELHSAHRDARARVLQAIFETEEARRSSERFREMAHRDPLTGLHNRRYVDELLPGLLARSGEGRTPLSAALIDLDYFKRVNDTLSHQTGDEVLQEIAAILSGAAEEAEPGVAVAARLGGEEFLLVLPEHSGDDAVRVCERLRVAIAEHPWQPLTGTLPVTVSIGLATVTDGAVTASALLSAADRSLYLAKRTGRNRVCADQI